MRFLIPVFIALTLIAAGSAGSARPADASDLFNKLKEAVDSVGTGTPTTGSGAATLLSDDDIIAGLKEALRVGTERVVGQIGAADGYNADPAIHIPLPPELQRVQGLMKKFGLSDLVDDVELKLNRAAEQAAPKTKELIWKAINEMTLDDAKRIYDGPDDAATQYFKKIASDDLAKVIKPIVDRTLNEVGAIAAYDQLMGDYAKLPLVPDVKADLSNHTVNLAQQGLFHYLAREEAAIRQNPAKRTTEILAKVFGG